MSARSTCRGTYYAFISILFLQFLNATITSFKYNKRLKLCSTTFWSHFNHYMTFFVSCCFHTVFSQQYPLLYLKPYPPKQIFYQILYIISAGWYEYIILFVIFLHVIYEIILKDQDISTLQRFLFAAISYVVSQI